MGFLRRLLGFVSALIPLGEVPVGVRRWLLGIGLAVGVFAVVNFFQGNDVKDYLSQQGLEVASAEVASSIHQINVEVDTTNGDTPGAYVRRFAGSTLRTTEER